MLKFYVEILGLKEFGDATVSPAPIERYSFASEMGWRRHLPQIGPMIPCPDKVAH